MRKFQVLGSAIVLALTGALIAAPADARTRHPSTPQERTQTRDLNLQQLAIAQGQAPANQQAMNTGQTEQQAPSNQEQATPPANAPSTNAPASGAQTPAPPSDQSTPPAQSPAPGSPQ
jgi:hypothetical protein